MRLNNRLRRMTTALKAAWRIWLLALVGLLFAFILGWDWLVEIDLAILGAYVTVIALRPWDKKAKVQASLIPVVVAVLIQQVTSWLTLLMSDPGVQFKVRDIPAGYSVEIHGIQAPVETIAIEIPVFGRVQDVVTRTSLVDTDRPTVRISDYVWKVQQALPNLNPILLFTQETVELRLEKLLPSAEPYEFVIRVARPPNRSARFANDHIYRASYSWFHQGDSLVKTQSLSMEGRVPYPSKEEVEGFTIYLGRLTAEEIRTLNKLGRPLKTL